MGFQLSVDSAELLPGLMKEAILSGWDSCCFLKCLGKGGYIGITDGLGNDRQIICGLFQQSFGFVNLEGLQILGGGDEESGMKFT